MQASSVRLLIVITSAIIVLHSHSQTRRMRTLSRQTALLFLTLVFLLPATAAERRPTEFGVCFHHGAFGNEYTPAAAAVLDDLRSAGKFWIRGDYQEPAKDARFAADMKRKG